MKTMVRANAVAISLVLSVAGATSVGSAQDRDTLVRMDDDEARLRAWAAVAAERANEGRMLMGGLLFGAGLLAAGTGVTALALDEPSFTLSVGVSSYLLAAGLVAAGLGLYQLITTSPEESLLQLLEEGPMDERTIGRLEGRLELAAERARSERIANGIFGGGAFLGSAVAATYMVAIGDPSTSALDYAIPIGLGLGGIILLVTSLFETTPEGDWREYQLGLAPRPRSDVSFRLAPSGFAVTF